MCDESSRREKREPQKIDDEEFYADPSFIIKKSFFRLIKGHPREEYVPWWPNSHRCLYPKPNSYYAFHEDTNPFTRFSAKCESRRYGNVQPHFEPPKEPYTIRDPYSENEAKRKYLGSTPTSFVILGKPDLNTTKLATMIANSWHCILISPMVLIKDEIEKSTETGKILADILKTGERLGPQIVMSLIANRLNKRDVFHRGYVVEGVPLIPNEILDYSSYSRSSNEQSNVENTFQKLTKLYEPSFQKICSTMAEFPIFSDQEFKNKKCQVKPKYEDFIVNQIEDIFTTWPIKPSIIIYAMCPDADVVIKREHFRIDPSTDRIVDTSLLGMSRNIETLFSRNKEVNDMNISFELYQELMNEERILDEHQKKYLLKRISDTKSNVEVQCKLYKRFALPVIEKLILFHNPQNVIRVDGRTPASRMFQIIVTRLRMLPLPRVILPRKYTNRIGFEGESPEDELLEEFEGKSNEEAFQDLANKETISPLYPWQLSPWRFLCPVELTRGTTTEGTPKHAVRFMNNVFFLSSPEAADLFIENPRTFLFPFSPRPTCKIAVFGPKYSGKSELSGKLAHMFRGTIINVNEIVKPLVNVDSDISIYSPDDVLLEEKTDTIVKSIQDVPKEEVDIEIWRDGGYIVDGMYPNVESWKRIVEDSKIIFEDVVLLFDEDPYEYLLTKWHNIHDMKEYIELKGEYNEYLEDTISESKGDEYDDDDEEAEESQGLIDYLRHIRQFEIDWENVRETVTNTCQNLILCNLKTISNVSDYVIKRIKNRYMDKARIMTDEEKEREKDLAEYIALTDTEDLDEEEELEGEKTTELDVKEDTRRLGDTGYYCPVALLRYNVFRRGKEEFSAIFMNKIYLLSSAAALEEFLRGPQELNLPFRKPLPQIPPFRVSIIGPLGSGKSILSGNIAREYGLAHIDHCDAFTDYMKNRGMPAISDRDIIISPENLLEKVELPEDLDDDRYNCDAATMQTFVQRYWRTGGTLSKKMLQECVLIFFEGLYNECGVVLDHFPSCPQNVQDALKNCTIPEIVIDLRCGKDTVIKRTLPTLLADWKDRLEEKQRIEDERYEKELEAYIEKQETWIDKMLDEMLDQHEAEEESSMDDNFESEATVLNREELEEIWLREHPEPVLFTDWEDFEEVKQRIEHDFEEMYEDEFQKLNATQIELENESIPYVSVSAEGNEEQVLSQVLQILDPLFYRDLSFIEKTYTIDLETAETLLDCGYYLPSSFGCWCPVQLHENKIPLQMFLPLEAQQEVYPVIYRQFVYFLGGKEAHSAFSRNPLKYLEQDSCAPVVPFRLSIIGPPKCGKTTLARRFANTYGLKIITRGTAMRHLVKYFSWTDSARFMESRLRAGHIAPEETVSRSVEMYSIDPASISQGFVLDGFPTTRAEYEQLTFLGIQPMIVLDLKADLSFCLECLSYEADRTTKPMNFSNSFLKHRYLNWEIDQGNFREWLKKFIQNVIEIDATKSTWYVWTRAEQEVCSRYIHVRTYFRESDYDKVHALKFMSVSPYEFKIRQSGFESYCPLCLYQENSLRTTGPPADHRGMFQYREHFYWICLRHTNEFVKNPQKHLPPINTAHLPENRPRILTEIVDMEHPCWARRLQVGGFCLVTYVENLPNRRLVPGNTNLGVLYQDNVYLFCTEECREKFLAQNDRYANVDIKFLHTLPPITIKQLPTLGFLKESVAKWIVEAVNQVSVKRPKIPGLSCSASAAIYIGVYLKTHNPSGANELKIYSEVRRRMIGYDNIIRVATRTMKKKLNPFVRTPIYKAGTSEQVTISQEVSITSQVYPRISNSIMFRRTSPTQILTEPTYESDD
nr:adenylate kinase 9-like [Osmia lignaria]